MVVNKKKYTNKINLRNSNDNVGDGGTDFIIDDDDSDNVRDESIVNNDDERNQNDGVTNDDHNTNDNENADEEDDNTHNNNNYEKHNENENYEEEGDYNEDENNNNYEEEYNDDNNEGNYNEDENHEGEYPNEGEEDNQNIDVDTEYGEEENTYDTMPYCCVVETFINNNEISEKAKSYLAGSYYDYYNLHVDSDGNLKITDVPVSLNLDDVLIIKGHETKLTDDVWTLLTLSHKEDIISVDRESLETYKNIMELCDIEVNMTNEND